MEINNEIKLLCLCDKIQWDNYIKSFNLDNFNYHIQFLSNTIQDIKYRLEHNSYDILIINYNYLKKLFTYIDMFTFSKLAFAMSRPTLILCNNKLQVWYLQFLLIHTKWIIKFSSAKSFVHISTMSDIQNNINIINNSPVYHQYLPQISKEIYTVFINQ